MSKKEDYKNELLNYLDEYLNSGNSDNIGSLLTSKSNLPGPRANLELRDVFAEVCGEKFNSDKQKVWKICLDFCGISAEEAPANNPHEFLPFCGAAALGNLGSHSEEYRSQAFKHLKSLANDSRWRIREAVSHSLTTILVKFPEITLDELESWLKKDNWLEMRAVAAAVGSPSFLAANSDAAKKALAFHRTIAQNMHEHFKEKSGEFMALRKGMGFTLSIAVAVLPGEGFQLMEELLDLNDDHLKWVIKENLKKNRLIKAIPQKIGQLEKKLKDN